MSFPPLDPTDLFAALSDERLHTVLQPLVTMRTGELTRFEALCRWTHPTRGEIPPSEFIPLAERAGVITPLTLLVLRQIAPALAHFRVAQPDLAVTLNVDSSTLLRPNFETEVASILARSGLPMRAIGLEITENTIMADPDRAREALEPLRSAGVRIDLDDFGTGYSSLSRLAELPLDAIKIDRQFVSSMTTDPKREAIVRATIALGHDLGLELVAEGVEGRETWEDLLALGCDTAQGYHIARPMPFDDVERWTGSWKAGLGFIRAAGLGGSMFAPDTPIILLVEDEPSIRELVKDILERENYYVLTAATGAEALRTVEHHAPKLLLLDVNVPIVSGPELVERVREKHPPVAVVVMAAGTHATRWAEKIGAQGFLAKPFGVQALTDLAAKFAR